MLTVYARTEHGGHKVVKTPTGEVNIHWPGGVTVYPNTRRAIIALYRGEPAPDPGAYDPHLTFDRYFRRGRYNAVSMPSVDVLDMFGVKPKILGIDLENRGIEVKKIFYAGFARQVARNGYDPEEILQEVYKALLIRNKGKCPWDEDKSSFAHYVHMVCKGTIYNYYRKVSRLRNNEQFGVRSAEGLILDVAETDLARQEAQQDNHTAYAKAKRDLTLEVRRRARRAGIDPETASRCLTLLSEGMRQKEITERTGYERKAVNDAVKLVRRVAQTWKDRSL